MLVAFFYFQGDTRHFIDGIVAALRRRTVTAHPLDMHLHLHAAAMAAVDVHVGRLGDHHQLRPDFLFLDEMLPAQSVAILFHHRAGEIDGELVIEI